MNKPLGCLSRSGLVTALLVLIVTVAVGLIWGGSLFSPGPLNAQAGEEPLGGVYSHAETGGRCSACHVALWSSETMADRCLLCHTDVAAQLSDPTSLHGLVMSSGEIESCSHCHAEHRGSDAPLTVLDPDTFPHEATGFSLAAHVKEDGPALACTDCHGEDWAHFDSIRCADCHRDLDAATMEAHDRAFGPDCLACHDGIDTYGAQFDHSVTAFPLEGSHGPLACADCHQQAAAIADLQGPPQDCFACHQDDDAHEGRYGQDCAACHSVEGWEQVTIDHDQTGFPLVGLHVDVACEDCHRDNVYQGTPLDCAACHEDPAFHRGLLGSDCASCHDAVGWSPARYDRTHTFPINHGEQGASPCRTCHPDTLPTYTCYDCHEHDQAETESKHREEGITDFEDCMRCHPTGREEEGEGGDD